MKKFLFICRDAVRRVSILSPMLTLLAASIYAQRPVEICGGYTYYAPENVSLEQAQRNAVESAKLEALAKKFGTTVTGNNIVVASDEREDFFMFGNTEVKGEWLEDTRMPETKNSLESGALVVTAFVCGLAREITGTGIDFSAKTLRNGTDDRFESADFRDGDELYLSFRSPVEGYLAVYLIDDNRTAYCLLPYRNDPTGKVNIKNGTDYVFFSEKHAETAKKNIVDEYALTCEKQTEVNYLYIIFSPNEFTKANDSKTNPKESLPRELPFDEFQKWLTQNRLRDKDMKAERKSLAIKKN